jgi:hypothetical protein
MENTLWHLWHSMPTASQSLVLPPDAQEEAIAKIIAKMQMKYIDSCMYSTHCPVPILSASLTQLKISAQNLSIDILRHFRF